MEIKNIKYDNRAKTTTALIKNTERILDTSVTQFIEGTPIECNYYSIDYEASSTGIGFGDDAGPFSGARKYNLIKNYIMYGYNEVKEMSAEEKEETGIRYSLAENSALHLPYTINPKAGDLLTLHIENNTIFYIVTNAHPTTLHNKPYVKTDWALCEQLPRVHYSHKDMVRDGLIVNEYDFIAENVGTDFTSILKSEFLGDINKLKEKREELNELFNDFFYDEFRNIYTTEVNEYTGLIGYIPLLVDYQMEIKPLYVYGVNAVLHHETIHNKRTTANWKKSKLRSFILKRDRYILDHGLDFKTWIYMTDTNDPNYKIQSYLNNDKAYKIYDYGVSESMENIKVPEEYIKVFEMYCNKEMNISNVLKTLEDVDINIDIEYLLYTPVLLSILDIYTAELMIQNKEDRFY